MATAVAALATVTAVALAVRAVRTMVASGDPTEMPRDAARFSAARELPVLPDNAGRRDVATVLLRSIRD